MGDQSETYGQLERIANSIEGYINDRIETDKVLTGLLRDIHAQGEQGVDSIKEIVSSLTAVDLKINVIERRLGVQNEQIATLQRLPNPVDLAKRIEAIEQTLPYFKERLAAIEQTLADH